MDELIYLLIKLIGELFGGSGQNTPKGPGYPNLPPRLPPVPPQQQDEIRRRMGAPPTKQPPQAAQTAKPIAVKKMPPRAAQRPAPPPVAKIAARAMPPAIKPPAPQPPVPRPVVAAVDATALRRWLKPATLHSQFILSEIFQPPVALREQRWT